METTVTHSKHPCPACGYYVFSELDNQAEICPICGWQNDLIDLQEMYQPMGPNKVSLEVAQRSFATIGAVEQRFVDKVRKPNEEDVRDLKWRPLDRTKDVFRPIAYDGKPEETYYWHWN